VKYISCVRADAISAENL